MSRVSKTGALTAVALLFGFSRASMAQEDVSLRAEGIRPYTIELKPLPTALSAIPENGAVGSIGVGGELFVNSKLAWFVDGQYVDVGLANNVNDKTKAANPGHPVPATMTGYEWLTGARVYGSPAQSSWYGALGIGYADTWGTYNYEDTSIRSHLISVLPTLTAGYRWLFPNNALVRAGIGAANNNVVSRRADAQTITSNSDDGERKVRNLQRTPVIAQIDLGIGYGF